MDDHETPSTMKSNPFEAYVEDATDEEGSSVVHATVASSPMEPKPLSLAASPSDIPIPPVPVPHSLPTTPKYSIFAPIETMKEPSVSKGEPGKLPDVATPEHRGSGGDIDDPHNVLQYLDPDSPKIRRELLQRSRYGFSWEDTNNADTICSPQALPQSTEASTSEVGSFRSEGTSRPPLFNSFSVPWSSAQSAIGSSSTTGSKIYTDKPFTFATPQPTQGYFQPYGYNNNYSMANSLHAMHSASPFPPSALQPQFSSSNRSFKNNSNVTREDDNAKNPQMSGYQLLAANLSSGARPSPAICLGLTPLYRRFATLNHRLLLHLQDEIVELEEQLGQLDAADTQARTPFHGRVYPASRRQESVNPSELFWRKTDILGRIGYKLWQYNQVLSSFKGTEGMTPPTNRDVQNYRTFLNASEAIADDERHFLDVAEDLVVIDPHLHHHPLYPETSCDNGSSSETLLTPVPRATAAAAPDSTSSYFQHHQHRLQEPNGNVPPRRSIFTSASTVLPEQQRGQPVPLIQVSLSVFVAVVVPLIVLPIIPDFVARMVVVGLVDLGVLTAALQSGLYSSLAASGGSPLPWLIYIGIYGAVMSVISASSL